MHSIHDMTCYLHATLVENTKNNLDGYMMKIIMIMTVMTLMILQTNGDDDDGFGNRLGGSSGDDDGDVCKTGITGRKRSVICIHSKQLTSA